MTATQAPSDAPEPLNLVLKRRLVGLIVLLVAGLVTSLLLRGKPGEEPSGKAQELQTIVVPLGGSTAAQSAAENSRKP